jgi:hypothetical protein
VILVKAGIPAVSLTIKIICIAKYTSLTMIRISEYIVRITIIFAVLQFSPRSRKINFAKIYFFVGS